MPGTDPDTEGKCPTGTYKSGGKCYPNEEVKKPTDSEGNCPTGYTKKGDACIGNKPLPDSDKGKDFCKENPTLDSCKTGSFVGSCTANFKCEGDAVQCAMAREQHVRNCALFETKSPESELYESNKGKQGNQTEDLPGNELFNMSGRIDTSNALGGGSCITDLTIEVASSSITIPMSRVCPYLGMLGNVLVAVAMLLAMRILFKG